MVFTLKVIAVLALIWFINQSRGNGISERDV
jgi:hypothetical protein